MQNIEQLNKELYKAMTDTLFSAGALKYMVSEKYPEMITKYRMHTGSDCVIQGGKKTMRLPTVMDLIKDIESVQKKVNAIATALRMRILKKGWNSDVTENIDYAIYMCQSALSNMEEDDIYREAARLSGRQVNVGDLKEQIDFLLTLNDEHMYDRIAKRIEVLQDIYNAPFVFENGTAGVKDLGRDENGI